MLNSTIYFFSMGVALMNSRVSDVHLTQKAKVKVRIYSNFINRSSKSKKKTNLTALFTINHILLGQDTNKGKYTVLVSIFWILVLFPNTKTWPIPQY